MTSIKLDVLKIDELPLGRQCLHSKDPRRDGGITTYCIHYNSTSNNVQCPGTCDYAIERKTERFFGGA